MSIHVLTGLLFFNIVDPFCGMRGFRWAVRGRPPLFFGSGGVGDPEDNAFCRLTALSRSYSAFRLLARSEEASRSDLMVLGVK